MTQHIKTKADIVADIRKLAESCFSVAVSLGYFGGFDSQMLRAERMLLSGSMELSKMADEIDGKVTT